MGRRTSTLRERFIVVTVETVGHDSVLEWYHTYSPLQDLPTSVHLCPNSSNSVKVPPDRERFRRVETEVGYLRTKDSTRVAVPRSVVPPPGVSGTPFLVKVGSGSSYPHQTSRVHPDTKKHTHNPLPPKGPQRNDGSR